MTGALRHRGLAVLALACLAMGACNDDPHGLRNGGEATGFGASYDRWAPGPNDTCTRETHNSYSVVGSDGLLYPTWHPPIDPQSGCAFGHEHGRDPRGSALYGEVGDIAFGRALSADHVGYKIEWEDDVAFHFSSDAANSLLQVRCDVMYELHQGSSAPGAFTFNKHEISLHAHCSDQTHVHIQMISAIGHPGEFVSSCDRDRTVTAGPPPDNSPDGGGKRAIPDRACIEQFVLVPEGERSDFGRGLRESWEISERVSTANGRNLVSFNPYFQILLPARYYDPASPNSLGRSLDVCFEQEPNGDRAQGGACAESTADGTITDISFDDPRSAFNGARRFVDVNSIRINNAEGPEIWYTDIFGKNGRPESFPGSIRQFVARVNNERAAAPSGPAIGRDRDYGAGQSVHAPN
ncbi:MAG: hypothetical protein JSU87_04765 [Gemmatimonadota bacterium]|nr:MAG: hypothetical protein JSU87_04765 [Gemmatimonadota bacterium]